MISWFCPEYLTCVIYRMLISITISFHFCLSVVPSVHFTCITFQCLFTLVITKGLLVWSLNKMIKRIRPPYWCIKNTGVIFNSCAQCHVCYSLTQNTMIFGQDFSKTNHLGLNTVSWCSYQEWRSAYIHRFVSLRIIQFAGTYELM